MNFAELQFGIFGIELPKLLYLLSTLVIIFPLSYIQKIHYFTKTSTFGFIISMISIASLLGLSFYYVSEDGFQPIDAFNFDGTMLYLGITIFAFEGIMTVLPIRDSMIDKNVI